MDTILFRNFVVRIARRRPTMARIIDGKEAEGYRRPPTVTGRNRRGTKGSRRGREGIGGLRNVPDDEERAS